MDIYKDDWIKEISVKDFRECGLLQELNRQFLHPIGFELSVKINDDGEEVFDRIWDMRDNEVGPLYFLEKYASYMDENEKENIKRKIQFFQNNANYVEELKESKKEARQKIFGNDNIIEPIPEVIDIMEEDNNE